MLDSGASMLPDPETYLTRDVYAFTLAEPEFDWSHAVKAMAQAQTMDQLVQGVPDFEQRVWRKVNLSFAHAYRVGIDGEFVADILKIQKELIPGFTAWWDPDPTKRTGAAPRLDMQWADGFLGESQTEAFIFECLQNSYARARFKTEDTLPAPPSPDLVTRWAKVWEDLEFYFHMFRRYMFRALTAGMIPRANDWFDLELMLYSLDDNHIVLTSDKKWESMAKEEGMEARIKRYKIVPKNP